MVIQYKDIELDTATRTARCPQGPVCLTPKECALMAQLLAAPGRTLSRAALLAAVWQAGGLRTRTVDMHIHLLRRKLGEAHRIRTVPRRGYQWEA